jgi:hypothetical protein
MMKQLYGKNYTEEKDEREEKIIIMQTIIK